MAEMKMKDFDLVGQLGKDLMLIEVTPKVKYELNATTGKNERTGEIEGYNYEVLMKDKKHKSIKVSVLGNRPIVTQDEIDKGKVISVRFEGLTCNPYVQGRGINLSFKAESMHPLV
ncbi:hypothetical protein OL233_05070 [Vagococcus sp. PNs007]|uniref:DUF961 domain-containing protein n=1 Tax=Vagococcus proximus TaxID=2991417 RepID=A0ABT5X0X6_9ENTE|nr:hypothetical protein [Vagococcus proximus]MDF0479654.1 hypothetical protein [Vagococcus proximus]